MLPHEEHFSAFRKNIVGYDNRIDTPYGSKPLVYGDWIASGRLNLVVRLLNDRFGIQVRGGCSCAGTYGHYLLHVDYYTSSNITRKIDMGDLSEKPGWVRLSIHPVMSGEGIDYIIDAVRQICANVNEWAEDYVYSSSENEYFNRGSASKEMNDYLSWFQF